MKKVYSLLFVSFIGMTLYAQDFTAEFTKALRDNDKAKQKEIIEAWDKSEIKNADYYLMKSEYQMTQAAPQKSSRVDLEMLNNSLQTLDEGIYKYPDRLDLRYTKISTLGDYFLWDDYTQEVIKAVDYSYINDNKWLMPGENADKTYFLKTLQRFQSVLLEEMDLGEPDQSNSPMLINARKISESILKYYPDDVDNLNNLAATYFYANDMSKALEIFQKAEKIAPKDAVVLLNIANIYAQQGDKQKAKAYYENIIKNCDKDAASQAKQLLKEL